METLLQLKTCEKKDTNSKVTILILVETLLQLKYPLWVKSSQMCHNPYFSGNSFATLLDHYYNNVDDESQSLF